jgi:hypothetical protein
MVRAMAEVRFFAVNCGWLLSYHMKAIMWKELVTFQNCERVFKRFTSEYPSEESTKNHSSKIQCIVFPSIQES